MIPKNKNPLDEYYEDDGYCPYCRELYAYCFCESGKDKKRILLWDLFFIEYPEYLEIIEKYKFEILEGKL